MNTKTEQLSLRMSPKAKALLRKAAAKEHRSASNMVEHLVLAYCEQHGVVLESEPFLTNNQQSPKKGSSE